MTLMRVGRTGKGFINDIYFRVIGGDERKLYSLY